MFDNRAEDDLDEEFQIDKVQAHTDGKLERQQPRGAASARDGEEDRRARLPFSQRTAEAGHRATDVVRLKEVSCSK